MSESEKTYASFEARVWDTLSRIDIQDHIDTIAATQKRKAISYLPWHKAWTLLKRNFPGSTYAHRPDLHHPDGTVEVEVDVIITDTGAEKQFTNARLAVMDQWFNPITNPHARDINDTRQRALVKALAFAGLGLNLWADSVIPVGRLNDPISLEQFEMLTTMIEKTETVQDNFLHWCGIDDLRDLPMERFPSAMRLLEAKLRRMAEEAEAAKAAKKK